MKLVDAIPKINPLVGKRFGTYLDPQELTDLRTNKGRVGQLLERRIGLRNSSGHLDFEDGELKTNKVDSTGRPRETVFITQISSHIDDLLRGVAFRDSFLYSKIRNLLYLPVCKEGPEKDWMFLPYRHAELESAEFSYLLIQLEKDWLDITQKIRDDVLSGDGNVHTANGLYIQVRTKDSKPYHPIHSDVVGRVISNKNYAFYFMKAFALYLKDRAANL